MLAKFNETMEPLYMLLKEIEDIRLTAELLDPDIDSRVEAANHVYDGSFSQGKWADKRKGLGGPYGHLMGTMDGNFNVKIEDAAAAAAAASNLPKKEQPIWMVESTISGASTFESKGGAGGGGGKLVNGNHQSANHTSAAIIETLDLNSLNGIEFESEQSKEVLQAVLVNEGKHLDAERWSRLSKVFGFKEEEEPFDPLANPPPPVIEVKEEPMDGDWTIENVDFFETLPKINVSGQPVPISSLSDEHICLMSDHEKQDYIRVAQQIYSAFFDI